MAPPPTEGRSPDRNPAAELAGDLLLATARSERVAAAIPADRPAEVAVQDRPTALIWRSCDNPREVQRWCRSRQLVGATSVLRLVDRSILEKLTGAFAQSTSLPVAVLDPDGTPTTRGTPVCAVCAR